MKKHQALPVADCLTYIRVRASECHQREILTLGDIVGVLLQHPATICGPLATLLLNEVIR